ncbi:trypco2 family protein [Actinacidiphila bryophytorum]|uniref:trypco2 family protein n=1 Tax=Actinacidiphila bryophytorum TaxID=1436133 RepID=UPI002176A0CE|nr:trypco2 family protein [Actinacidiphila bryophytorum]UWE09354.1 hypothetical protein NYE86_11870 [Actinacidiphila bryophytorum]
MIELTEVIRELRNQLSTALAEAGPGPLRFELGPVEIEATITVDRTGGAGGKVTFWVVEAHADASVASSHTHRVSLTLQPTLVDPDGAHHRVLIAGDEVNGER